MATLWQPNEVQKGSFWSPIGEQFRLPSRRLGNLVAMLVQALALFTLGTCLHLAFHISNVCITIQWEGVKLESSLTLGIRDEKESSQNTFYCQQLIVDGGEGADRYLALYCSADTSVEWLGSSNYYSNFHHHPLLGSSLSLP